MTQLSKPVIAVIGTTGTGKSQLAIDLCLALAAKQPDVSPWTNGRVINADAMQVYKGLDIATNKVTEEEMCGVAHRLMDIKDPTEEYFITQWIRDANKEIEEGHARQEVPIIVGGTTYWIQHLIFPNRLASLEYQDGGAEATSSGTMSPSLQSSLEQLSDDLKALYADLPAQATAETVPSDKALALYKLLCALDPRVGGRWHWKDTRKVLRSLQVIKETGRTVSETMEEQDMAHSTPRYPTLIFWLYAEPNDLNPRLDLRVEKMLERGLLGEIRSLRGLSGDTPIDYTRGIYQTIGFKEFDEYLSSYDDDDRLLQNGLNEMKHRTRKYAQRQTKWITNKLLPAIYTQDSGPPLAHIYLLDASDLSKWDENVKQTAFEITRTFLGGQALPPAEGLSTTAAKLLMSKGQDLSSANILAQRRRVLCEVCTTDPNEPVMIEEGNEWRAHVCSRAHQSRAGREKRIAEQMAAREEKQRERATRSSTSTSPTRVETS